MSEIQKVIIVADDLGCSDWNQHLELFLGRGIGQYRFTVFARSGGELERKFGEKADRVQVIPDLGKMRRTCAAHLKNTAGNMATVLLRGIGTSSLSELFWSYDLPVIQIVDHPPATKADAHQFNKNCCYLGGIIFASDEVRRATVSASCHSTHLEIHAPFCGPSDRLLELLPSLAEKLQRRMERERNDCKTISASRLFDIKFAYPWIGRDRRRAIKKHTTTWCTGINLRKPFPGFHPGIYEERNGVDGGDPMAHYIRHGQPEGPWDFSVIRAPIIGGGHRSRMKTALHIHCFYRDHIPSIIAPLLRAKSRPDLYISVPSEAVGMGIRKAMEGIRDRKIDIRTVPNRGRDIGPMLTEFSEDLKSYEVIGHYHTKESLGYLNRRVHKIYINFLRENMLGGRKPMIDVILKAMERDPGLGLVFPDDPHVIDWMGNRDHALALMQRMGFSQDIPERHLNFPVGSMFWARSKALQPLFDLNLDWSDYPEEPIPDDGTMLHAIERILPIVSEQSGYRNAVTHVRGVPR